MNRFNPVTLAAMLPFDGSDDRLGSPAAIELGGFWDRASPGPRPQSNMVTTTGIVLSDPATQSPLVLDASSYVTNTTTLNSGDAIVSTVTGDWSITNYGRIVATRSDGHGINLSFGGTSTVTNFATVTASGTYGIGILIDQGTVYNRTGGVISALGGAATGRGVEVSGYGGRVVNSGTISAELNFSVGVKLEHYGTVINGAGGATDALIVGKLIGINILNNVGGQTGAATVVNYGTVIGESTFPAVSIQSGVVVNGAANNTAALLKGGYGIESPASVTLTNFGTIFGNGATGPGVYSYGIHLTNAGLVKGRRYGVRGGSFHPQPGTVVNSGMIIGYDVTGGIGVAIDAPTTTIVNSGTIIGASGTSVALGGAGNLIAVTPGAVFSGKVDGGATGTGNTLELAGGAGAGTLTGLGTGFVDFDTVVIDANAAWRLAFDNPAAFSGTIFNFTNDDSIDLTTIPFDPNGSVLLGPNNVLQVSENGTTTTIALDPSGSFAGSFRLVADGLGGSLITLGVTPLTVAEALAAYAADPNMLPVQVVDSTLNVGNGVDPLQVLTAHGKLISIGLTDTDRVTVAPNQLQTDAATLALIVGPYSLHVLANNGSVNYTLASNVNDLLVSGETSAAITGNVLFNVIIVGSGNDTVHAGNGGSYIVANGGDDSLFGGGGGNTIYAIGGNNYIQGGAGSPSDVLVATGTGSNTIYGGSGNNYIVAGGGKNTLVGGGGINSLYGSGSADYVVGGTGSSNVISESGSGTNSLWGGSGNNYIVGGSGPDLVVGGGNSDYLFGGAGADTVYGGAEVDYIFPGAENDFIWTDNVGASNQDFVYESLGTGIDTIADFVPGNSATHDVLVISGSSLTTFADIQANAVQAGVYTVIPLSPTDQVYLYNVQPFQLVANNFLFF